MDEGRNMVLMFPAIIKFKSEEAKESFQPTLVLLFSSNTYVKTCKLILMDQNAYLLLKTLPGYRRWQDEMG